MYSKTCRFSTKSYVGHKSSTIDGVDKINYKTNILIHNRKTKGSSTCKGEFKYETIQNSTILDSEIIKSKHLDTSL